MITRISMLLFTCPRDEENYWPHGVHAFIFFFNRNGLFLKYEVLCKAVFETEIAMQLGPDLLCSLLLWE